MSGVISIKEASLEQVLPILQSIPEFASPVTLLDLEKRLQGKKALVLLALVDGEPAGVKIGYELSQDCFYSWLGGVKAIARGHGVAQSLLDHQEAWASQNGYATIRVKTRNQFANMIHMLVKNRYLMTQVEPKPDPLENRLIFEKSL